MFLGNGYSSGRTLKEIIELEGQLNICQSLFYFQRLLQILVYLRDKSVIHDDIKGEKGEYNIIFIF